MYGQLKVWQVRAGVSCPATAGFWLHSGSGNFSPHKASAHPRTTPSISHTDVSTCLTYPSVLLHHAYPTGALLPPVLVCVFSRQSPEKRREPGLRDPLREGHSLQGSSGSQVKARESASRHMRDDTLIMIAGFKHSAKPGLHFTGRERASLRGEGLTQPGHTPKSIWHWRETAT